MARESCRRIYESGRHLLTHTGCMGNSSVLTVNGGSSSIKFAAFETGDSLQRTLSGKLDRIGLPGASLIFQDMQAGVRSGLDLKSPDPAAAIEILLDWLEERLGLGTLSAVGHRVVHGMEATEPQLVTEELLDRLCHISPYDPEHLPREIELIRAFRRRRPDLLQIVCFDTAFHRTMPRVARLLPIPRRFEALGIQRYGFHGISYSYLLEELARLAGEAAARGRVILAHLGNGASLAAVRDGKSVDTSMGFTPAAGLMMGTRPGDIDPGVAWYLMRSGDLTPDAFNRLMNHECGLLGVSETSSDMRDLLERQSSDERAADAVELFCYHARRWIGAFCAVLGGLDTLVFAGGIGENTPEIRARICADLGFLGIELDRDANSNNGEIISNQCSRAAVRIIRTDEELMIARVASRFAVRE